MKRKENNYFQMILASQRMFELMNEVPLYKAFQNVKRMESQICLNLVGQFVSNPNMLKLCLIQICLNLNGQIVSNPRQILKLVEIPACIASRFDVLITNLPKLI